MRKKDHTPKLDLGYTEEEQKANVIAHAERMRLFFTLKKKHPKLCKTPETVYTIINHYIPDDFYERYAIAYAKKHRKRLESMQERMGRINFAILDLLTAPNPKNDPLKTYPIALKRVLEFSQQGESVL